MTDKPSKLRVKGIETEAVQAYLAQYPFLKPVLEEAEERVTQYFGDDVELVYTVVHDAEVANWITLFGAIWNDLPVEDALNRLEKFDWDWYLELPFEVRDKLIFQIR
jgi:uncharacterized protein (DUF1810 family)